MTAASAAVPPATDQETALAARLCWHAVRICSALDQGVAELQVALADAAEHTDAIIELAMQLADATGGASTTDCAAEPRR